jgi:hypothetical protein
LSTAPYPWVEAGATTGGEGGERSPASDRRTVAVLTIVLVELVALVLVLAIVLAAEVAPGNTVLPSGVCGARTCDLGLLYVTSSGPVLGAYEENFSVDPAGSFTTADFALEVLVGGTVLAPGSAPPGCTALQGGLPVTFNATTCGAPSTGWYAVLVPANGTVGSVFDDAYRWSGPPLGLSPTWHLDIVSGASLHSGIGTLTSYGLGAYEVEGYWNL